MTRRLHIKVPSRAAKGEVIRLMTKLHHPMESGWRKRQNGDLVPKDLVGEFVCSFNGREVFRAELEAGTASDPFLAFYAKVEESGVFSFVWSAETGDRFEAEARVAVE